MFEAENFAEENLMIELGQMPAGIILEQLYQNNLLKEEEKPEAKKEIILPMDLYQAWSWA